MKETFSAQCNGDANCNVVTATGGMWQEEEEEFIV